MISSLNCALCNSKAENTMIRSDGKDVNETIEQLMCFVSISIVSYIIIWTYW